MQIDQEEGEQSSLNLSTKIIYDEERKQALKQRLMAEQERMKSLPQNSQYVRHRKKVLTTALSLLDADNLHSDNDDTDQLTSLLQSLSLSVGHSLN